MSTLSGEYGSIFSIKEPPWINGRWIRNIIQSISQLYCSFSKEDKHRKNGIRITEKKHKKSSRIGSKLACFLISTYIITKQIRNLPDKGKCTITSPMNLILDSINHSNDPEYHVEYHIETILNHPHFEPCKKHGDLLQFIETVDNLNNYTE